MAGKEEHSSSEEPSAQKVELPAFKGATHEMGFGDLIEEAKAAQHFEARVNVNDDRFLAPDSMIDEIRLACFETGQDIPTTIGELMRCMYLSLSTCYAESIEEMASLTGRTYTSINIVGGGCQDSYLKRANYQSMRYSRTSAGPVEGTESGQLDRPNDRRRPDRRPTGSTRYDPRILRYRHG